MLVAHPVQAGGHQQGPDHAAVHEPLGQPARQQRCCRAAPRTTARGRPRATRTSGSNTMIGDGGQSGFDVARAEVPVPHLLSTPAPRSTSTTATSPTGSGPATRSSGTPGTQFYAPVISDPKVSGTMFAGTGRHGLPDQDLRSGQPDASRRPTRICNEWTGTFEATCGDWERARARPADRRAFWGDRAGGAVAAIERTTADTSTAWAATTHRPGLHLAGTSTPSRPARSRWTRLDDDAVDPEPVRQQHLRRPGQRQPRLDLLQRLQRRTRRPRPGTSSR